MTRRNTKHLFSRSLVWGWSLPLLILALPIATFNVADPFWCAVALTTVAAAVISCRLAENSRDDEARQVAEQRLPSPRQCRGAVFLFSLLACLGSLLIIQDQQGVLGGLQFDNLQQRYIALTQVANAGDRLGTGLSTFGNILRAPIYIAIVAMVGLSRQVTGVRRWFAPALVLTLALVLSELATASRTYVVFCVLVGVVAGILTGHPLLRRGGTILGLVVLGGILLSITMAQRIEQTLGDQALAFDYVAGFFDVEVGRLGHHIADLLGVPALTAVLYLAHSLPEFSKLVADGSTQYAMGAHSLYLVVGPTARLFGYTVDPTTLAERPGMWWGMLGDLYLDFGVAFVLVYPLLAFLMVRLARRMGSQTVYGLTVNCMTAAMFFASAYFGVLSTYSFAYIVVILLGWLRLTIKRMQTGQFRAAAKTASA